MKYLILVFLIISFSRCSQKKAAKTVTAYSSIDVYCWCFSSNDYESVSRCETIIGRPASEIAQPANLMRSVTDKETIQNLQKIIFTDNKTTTWRAGRNPDARFVLVGRAINTSDTLVFFTDSAFYFNRESLFQYPFRIIDSIKKELSLSEIDCP